jgi:hypothetical protein
VWWQGSLVLGGYGGGPGGGWYLDQAPPGRAMTGDLFYNGSNTITSNQALIRWDGDDPPKQQDCANLVDTQLGQQSVDVRKGTMACVKTAGGRVGYVRVDRISDSSDLNPTMTVAVVVWDRT